MQPRPPADNKKAFAPAPAKPKEEAANVTDKKIAELEVQFKEAKDKYLRTYADLENFKKRAVKDREELVAATSERLLRELLDVKDHLELAIDHSKGSADVKTLHEGVTLTLKQLGQFLEKFGVTELKSLGEKFDPAFHEALVEEESSEVQPGSVVREFQKGYLCQGRLLRPARVVVAKGTKS